MARQALGSGLDALIGTQVREDTLPISEIVPGKYQPRTMIENVALDELAQSIREFGVMQPILVRQKAPRIYEIIAGERRYQAAKKIGLKDIPAIIKTADDRSTAVMALIENIQREDLNPLEQARGIQRLIDEFAYTHETVAKVLGKSRSAVTNTLRLTSLAPKVQEWLMAGDIEMGHARCLITLDTSSQIQLAQRAKQEKLTVREVENLAKKFQANAGSPITKNAFNPPLQPQVDHDLQAMEEDLSDRLATSIKISHKKDGFIFTAELVNQEALNSFVAYFKQSIRE